MLKLLIMYLPCIFLEKGGQSPFGDLQESYVVVTYNGSGYNYYYTCKDTAGYGITLTAEGLLDENSLKPGTTSLDLNIGVGERSNIIEFGNSCKSNDYTTRTATKTIEENKSFDLGVQELITSTPSNCFEIGTVFSSEKENNTDYIYAVEITNKKVDYNIASMFQYVITSWYAIESVTLNNNSNLNVYYKLANNNEWKPFNVGMTIGYDNLDSLTSKMEISPATLDEFYNSNFSIEKMSMQIIPSVNIKVENNGKVVFATSPTIFQRK